MTVSTNQPWPFLAFLTIILIGRGLDVLSTWIATPRLILEANPIARKLGWSGILLLNITIIWWFAHYAVPALALTITSCLVAMRNFQVAWIMQSVSEETYRVRHDECIKNASIYLFLGCLAGQVLIPTALGVGLLYLNPYGWLPEGCAMGLICYALAIGIHTSLDFYKTRIQKS